MSGDNGNVFERIFKFVMKNFIHSSFMFKKVFKHSIYYGISWHKEGKEESEKQLPVASCMAAKEGSVQ
jgi:hypothetical protein